MASNYNVYYNSKPVSDWTANGSKESGHNFTEQIDDQQGVINAKQGEYDTQTGQVGNAQNAYDNAYQNQTQYGDLYKKAKEDEGVEDARAQYQKSLASVNATQSAMNNLPSSINAGSNVVLNASQRNAALGNQMSKFQNTLDYQTRQNAGDLSQYQTALAAAQDLAKTNMGQEQFNVSNALANLQTQMDYANNLYNQLIQERQIMRSIYGDMYEDEYKHMQQELEIWAQKLQAETARYAQDQETARNNARIAAEKATADISKYLGSGYTWNGNEWVKEDNSKKLARATDLDNIQKVYAAYQAKLGDLDAQTNDFGTYINPFGSNGLFGSFAGFNSTRNQANNLRNKGFEDFLYNYSADGLNGKYLQKLLREDYSDMLSAYGLS